MAIGGGRNVSELYSCIIAAWLECFPEKSSWCLNEQVCHERTNVNRIERSNGMNTVLN